MIFSFGSQRQNCLEGGPLRQGAGQRRVDADGHFTEDRVLCRRKGGEVELILLRRGRLHGRLAAADGVRRDRDDPVPRARRRQPRPDGREHAASGRAADRSEAPLVGTGMELRAAVDAGDVVVTEKAGVVEEVSADYVTVMADDGTRRLPDAQVRALQPGHLRQPASDRGRGPAGRVGAGARRRSCAENGEMAWAGTCSWRSCRGRATTTRTRSSCAAARGGGRPHLDPHRGARDRRPRHQARCRGVTRDIPNVSDEALESSTSPASSVSVRRSATATCWSARSHPKGEPSSPPRSGC